ncbi:hypothetical protein K8B83_12710 [Shewanella inventionis]|uniref:Uncharacterized protein n=1 Tax=Shewanella inventionis TaxID=1738770 RepID=A0ABQ1JKG2_9GAMM|nr:hypothetical protein [Shewanella inventionis]MCL1158410.1 hypothetical protein [Shewanella inventionis]UAL41763.1 hypothetical protein K8B83_12710 [Shewanella inventionis]GGB68590.1 hypothetical protein GCM10011607_31510 [Shewanella inventionis]
MAKINVAIDSHKVAQLIRAGHLCAADLHCLDKSSKQTLWQLCLWSCQNRIGCQKSQCQQTCSYAGLKQPAYQVIHDKDIC